jgi:Xaa-Pro aminopeptidase
VADLFQRLGSGVIGFEESAITYAEWRELDEALDGPELIPVENLIAKFRMIKSADEVAAIRKAARIADDAFAHISGMIRPGMTEREIALEIDCFVRRNGAEEVAFETLVAEGERSALPHAKPTDRQIREQEFVVLDFGARVDGYHSDITRTLLFGAPDERRQRVYDIVLEAQRRAIAAIKPGLQGSQVDAVARDYIAEQGYGEYFGHGLGHGLGLEIHDGRILTKKSEIVLRPGMIMTVEPGIYIPGWGGVRIEDDVLVTQRGSEVLTHSPRSLNSR